VKKPKNQKSLRLYVTLISVFFCVLQTQAIEVSGLLSGGTWTIEDSPVIVEDNIQLPQDAELTIEPGVRVEFNGPYSFLIEGRLRALGDSLNRIAFSAGQPDVDSLRWRGLRFVNARRGSVLRFCDVQHGWARGDWPENCGGGIYIEGCSPEIRRCTISDNRADHDGGGIYAMFSTSLIHNNLIVGNYAGNFGGGFFISYAEPNILNCTVALDTALHWGGGLFVGSEGSPRINNCIVAYNEDDLEAWAGHDAGGTYFSNIATARSSSPVVTFTCAPHPTDPYPGQGNIFQEPEFISLNPDSGYDFHLQLSSPCIDAGDPMMNPGDEPDVLINRINMGAYGGTEEAALSVPVIYILNYDISLPLEYGSIRINSQSTKEMTIENHGHYRLFIYDFAFNTAAYFPDSLEVDQQLVPEYAVAPIEPGESAKYNVNFKPTELIDFQDTLRVISNDTLQDVPFIVLTGAGIDPVAVINGSVLDFGDRQIDSSHDSLLYVRNEGSSDLLITSLRIQGEGFSATTEDNLSISPGDSGRIDVTFTPISPENYEALLTVNNNDIALNLPLRGKGSGPKMAVESDTLFMGYVYAGGDTATYTVGISNRGADVLRVDNARLTDPAFSVTIPNGVLEVPADSTAQLAVNFHPPRPDEDFTDLLIISGENYPLPDTVELSGRGMTEPGEYVFGDVGGRTWEWSDDHPDYIVLDSVYVPPHERLRIMKGARILFEPNAFMQVDGELRAVGLPDDSISFLPRDLSGTDEARWGGLFLTFEDATRMSYCRVRGSRGGIRIREASPLIQFCTIADNQDTTDGGGIYFENSGARIAGCVIEQNAARNGGGMYILNSKPTITNCIIRNNRAEIDGSAAALRFQAGALLQSCLFHDNVGGAAISVREHSSPRLINTTIADNEGGGVGAAIRSIPVLINTILWNNGAEELRLDPSSNALVSYCDVEDGFEGTNNLDTDPLFDHAAGSYRLSQDSPLIDMGNPEASYRDHFIPPSLGSDRCDIGAYGGPLGGSWTISDVSITLFQNPAFPHWIDIFVTSLDGFQDAPLCSLELGENPGEAVLLSPNPGDAFTYMGSYEARYGGTLFITVDATLTGGGHQRVSRSYELNVIGVDGGTIRIAGIQGAVVIPPGCCDRTMTLLTGFETFPLKPSDGRIFLSPLLFISGLDQPLKNPVYLKLDFNTDGWSDQERSGLGIYRFTDGDWTRLPGGYESGQITGLIDRGGWFAVAWSDISSPTEVKPLPGSAELINAYPNPFNQKVTIKFSLTERTRVHLAVYDLAGRRVANLINGSLDAGVHMAVWDGHSNDGALLPSGIYCARLGDERGTHLVKLLLLR